MSATARLLLDHPFYLLRKRGSSGSLLQWRPAPALLWMGSVILAPGAVCLFVYPAAVNRGSGQDVVELFAIGFAFLSAVVGLILRKRLPPETIAGWRTKIRT